MSVCAASAGTIIALIVASCSSMVHMIHAIAKSGSFRAQDDKKLDHKLVSA